MPVNPNSLSLMDGIASDAGARVAFGDGDERSGADFSRDVSSLAAELAAFGSGRWVVDTVDRYAAAVCLFALAKCRSLAVLPPNRQPETLARDAEGALGILEDPAEPGGLPKLTSLGSSRGVHSPKAGPDGAPGIDRDAAWIEFRTSGSSGDARPMVKAMRHLEDEVGVLESRLGHGLPRDAHFFATASHRHIYGLLFGILWPLATGRPFQREVLLHAQELLPRMETCNASVLVTTPIHLKRIAETANLEALRPSCRRVFSSGGPLDPGAAAAVAARLEHGPYEIFGSTETGGVAIRCRDRHGEDWEPLSGVEIRRCDDDGRMEVTSPFVSEGERLPDGRNRMLMGDRIEWSGDGRFRVLGRADRIVKIAEKRLSLPEMERALCDHPFVSEAALLVREIGRERRVHAVVATSKLGRDAFVREGARSCRMGISDHLAKRFDRVFLPRAWRFVAALPRDAQDKVPLANLRALFEESDGGARPTSPRVLAEKRSPEFLERRLEIPGDLAQLEGHFDAMPVVAGVVQLDWALRAASDWLGAAPTVAGLRALKFPQPLLPGTAVTLRLERSSADLGFRFRVFDGERVFATGRALIPAERSLAGDE